MIEYTAWKTAMEIEMAPKGATRMLNILDVYALSQYALIEFLGTAPNIARLIARRAADRRAISEDVAEMLGTKPKGLLTVKPW